MLAACATVSWYGQAVRGQIELLAKREDIAEVIEDPATDPALRGRLEAVLEMRAFAVDELRLPDNRSYTHYAELGREAAVWNVVAAPEFSMRPKTWCYPLVGCLAYRGYFRRDRAEAEAARLAGKGFDTAVFPVAAYSTLGWFADPVLDTMLDYDEPRLAGLIFHELSHQKLHVRGDTAFNEAYAGFVEREGVRRWLEAGGDAERLESWREQRALERAFTDLVLASRERLKALYARELEPEAMRREKRAEFQRLRKNHEAFARQHDTRRFDGWFGRELNNAHLAMVATYEAGVDAFAELHAECAGDMICFHDRAESLADAGPEERREFLHGKH